MPDLNIAIIGAGALGSRHLQALASIDRPASVQVVDTSDSALENAQEIFNQTSGTGNIRNVKYLENLADLSGALDSVIVATNADVRRKVVEILLSNNEVKNLILEKILFQRLEDFAVVNNLLTDKGVRAWVNCTRRMWPIYSLLKEKFEGARKVDYNATGSQWGLGCNGIHFLDSIAYLTGETKYTLNPDQLDVNTMQGRRQG